MAPTTTRSPLLIFVLVTVASACGASASSGAGSVEVTRAERPMPNTCAGCQQTMGNTCMRILGAAVDRPGVTVARLCDPWCCQLTKTEFGDVGYVHTVHNDAWSTCPNAEVAAAPGTASGALDGSVVEGPDLLVPRATVVLAGVDQTIADTTNELGRFHIDDLSPGHYSMTVYYGDVVFKKQCIRVLPGETGELHVNLDVKIRTDEFFIVE